MEDPEFSVLLTGVGDRRLDLVRVVRSVSGLSLWDSKLLLDAVPAVVVKDTWYEAADEVARRLEAAGARAALSCGWCSRTIPCGTGPVDPGPCEAPYWPAENCRASSPKH
ncbi:ribosomal protein L7/L12 [Kitasatospora sp. NBC_01250]|uniref:ribosomal protein L7/L12 n=1 Tax=Kitasatospora sp. NBC_01250 TaxID=2903571 RepID=UPI002E32A00A|nr:ribosomal protein L7/L12 [Kitasatospora sp. NBC_01250]